MNFTFQWVKYFFENSTTEVINETKEIQNWNGVSVALHVFLPVAGLAILWGRRDIFTRLLLQIDRSCVSVFCPSFSRREKLLQWASTRLPTTWSSQSRTLSGGIVELWKDGSLLCTLINTAIPGACPNPHRHWKKPPAHAQAIAYKYLGIIPRFTESDFKGGFTVNQERNLIHYLNELNQAINTLPPKDDIEKTFTSQYVARGMGLFTGEQYRKTTFYLYSNSKSKMHSNVLIHIRGPYATFGKAVVPPFTNVLRIPQVKISREEEHKFDAFEPRRKKSFLKAISIDFNGFSNKKPCVEDIPISVEMERDRAKISYIPRNHGMYEINMICEGELLRGSPFSVHVTQNISNIEDSFEIKSNISEDSTTFKRKIISKIIDFIDEKTVILPRRLSRAFALDGYHSTIINNFKDDGEETNSSKGETDINLNETDPDLQNHNKSSEQQFDHVDDKNINITKLASPLFTSSSNLDPQYLPTTTETNRTTICHKISEEDDETVLESKKNEINTNNKDSITSEIKPTLNVQNITSNASINEVPPVEISNKLQSLFLQKNTINNLTFNIDSTDYVASENIKNLTHKNEKSQEILNENNDLKTTSNNIIGKTNNLTNGNTIIPNNNNLPTTTTTTEKNNLNNIHKTLNVKAIESKKYIKNIVNRSNKDDTNKITNNIKISQQYWNGKLHNTNKIENSKIQKAEIVQDNSPSLLTQVDIPVASPICPNHIAPEVNTYTQLSIKERRKIFARQSSITSSNSSFSENENVVVSPPANSNNRFIQSENNLNVSKVLEKSIKVTESFSDEQSCSSLSSTHSLPVMSSSHDSNSLKNWSSLDNDINQYHGFVKRKREYWDKLSMSSSNSINDYQSYESLGKRKLLKNNCQSLNKLYNTAPSKDAENIIKDDNMSKSFNDILSVKEISSNTSNSLKKCFSACDDKEDFSLLSIEERKKMLLKDNYIKESTAGKRHHFVVTKMKTPIVNGEEKEKKLRTVRQRMSSSISNVIRKFDKKSFPATEIIEIHKENDSPNIQETANRIEATPKKPDSKEPATNKSMKDSFKSRFRKTVNYFKQLEQNSSSSKNRHSSKQKTDNNHPPPTRRYSVDVLTKKQHKETRKGGSLRISEKFSIFNLYDDVVGSKKGSLRGVPNQNGASHSLGSLKNKIDNSSDDRISEEDEEIKFHLFINKSKKKVRKSIKSLFETNY